MDKPRAFLFPNQRTQALSPRTTRVSLNIFIKSEPLLMNLPLQVHLLLKLNSQSRFSTDLALIFVKCQQLFAIVAFRLNILNFMKSFLIMKFSSNIKNTIFFGGAHRYFGYFTIQHIFPLKNIILAAHVQYQLFID